MVNILFPGQTLLIANYALNFRSLGMIESLGNFIHHYILHFALLNKNRERGGGDCYVLDVEESEMIVYE